MHDFELVLDGLRFPEGPLALADGSILVSEVAGARVSRIVDGRVARTYAFQGTPAGCALGPDGALYVCNSGGTTFRERDGRLEPSGTPAEYAGGRIERLDLATGAVQELYRACDGHQLSSPNDIVFDAAGGFYFTDIGKTRDRDRDRGAVYYAQPDGSGIRCAAYPMETPNGIGLSPDGSRLYVAETIPGRLWSFEVTGPGMLRTYEDRFARGDLVAGLPGLQCFDSLAVQVDGSVCVATLVNGGITRISPDGSRIEHFPFPDAFTTNLCFGGPGLKTAYVALSSSGRLVAAIWDTPGLKLHFG